MNSPLEKDQADFGFRRVAASEKTALVSEVFARVASRYDVMNDFMSLGIHRLWKREMVATLAPQPGWRVLDLAGGTGDIAFRIMDKVTGYRLQVAAEPSVTCNLKPVTSVTICDINPAMLQVGRDRAIAQNRLSGLEWVCGNAESLPFPDAQFDAATIAFGIRNVTDIPAALRSIHRVLKPGGRFLCLEFSRVAIEALAPLYDAYSFKLIPKIGALVAGDRDAYQYLVESIRKFPPQERFAEMLREAGFARVTWRNLSAGVVALHSGWRV
jgi:ubiquinone/menaquinone biosynthesis methyltransferase